jgi:hypothetical protein
MLMMIVKIEFDPETPEGQKLLSALIAADKEKKTTVILAEIEPEPEPKAEPNVASCLN